MEKFIFSEWNENIDKIYKANYFKILEHNEKFNSLEEIRKEIDEIDIKVFDLICERKNLVSQVIKFKKKRSNY